MDPIFNLESPLDRQFAPPKEQVDYPFTGGRAVGVLRHKDSGRMAADIEHRDGSKERKWINSLVRSKNSNRQYVVTEDNDVFFYMPKDGMYPEQVGKKEVQKEMAGQKEAGKKAREEYLYPFLESQLEHHKMAAESMNIGPVSEMLNTISAGFWGLTTGMLEGKREGGAASAIHQGITKSLNSVWDTIWKRGDWGVQSQDFLKTATGKSVEAVKEDIKKHFGSSIAKKVSDFSVDTLLFLANVAPDLGAAGAVSKLGSINRLTRKSSRSVEYLKKLQKELVEKGKGAEATTALRNIRIAEDLAKIGDRRELTEVIRAIKKNEDIMKASRKMRKDVIEELRGVADEMTDLRNKIGLKQKAFRPEEAMSGARIVPKVSKVEKRASEQSAQYIKVAIQGGDETQTITPRAQGGAYEGTFSMFNKKVPIEGGDKVETIATIKQKTNTPAAAGLDTEQFTIGTIMAKENPELVNEIIDPKMGKIVAEDNAWFVELDRLAGAKTEAGEKARSVLGSSAMRTMEKDFPNITDGVFGVDTTGLGIAEEMINRGIKAGRFKRLSSGEVKHQIDSVFHDVARQYKDRFDEVGMYRLTSGGGMRSLAHDLGYRLTKSKKEGMWRLKKYDWSKNTKPKKFNDLDEVSKYLGMGDDSRGVVKELNDFRRGIAAISARKHWTDWAFPSGMDNIKVKDAYKAASRMKKLMEGRKAAKISLIDSLVANPRNVLKRTPAGRKLYELMSGSFDELERNTAEDFFNIESILRKHSITDDELEQVRFSLEGMEDKVGSAKAKAASEEIRSRLDEIYNRAKEAGIKVSEYRKDYFPHRLLGLEELEQKSVRKFTVDAIEREGLEKWGFESREHLEKVYDEYVKSLKAGRPTPYFGDWVKKKQDVDHHTIVDFLRGGKEWEPKMLTKRRSEKLPVPFYDRRIHNTLYRYLSDANNAIVYKKNLGGYIKKGAGQRVGTHRRPAHLMKLIDEEGGNVKVAEEVVGRLTQPWMYPHGGKAGRAVTGFQIFSKLDPFTTAINYTQSLAIPMRTSVKALYKGMKNYDREFAERTGAIVSQTLHDITAMEGGRSAAASWYLRKIGFTAAERRLRILSANAGKAHAEDLAELLRKGKKVGYAKRSLRDLGVDPEKIVKRGFITEDELKTVAKQVSDQTQFRGGVLELPVGWLGPYARPVTQFKTFIYGMGQLLGRTVGTEFTKGNLRPLLYFSTVYPAVGMGWDKVVDQMLLGKESPGDITTTEGFAKWYWEGISSIGALGIFEATLNSLQYGPKSLYEFATGPTVSDAVGAIFLATDMLQGEDDWGKSFVEGAARRAGPLEPAFRGYMQREKKRARQSGGYGEYGAYE